MHFKTGLPLLSLQCLSFFTSTLNALPLPADAIEPDILGRSPSPEGLLSGLLGGGKASAGQAAKAVEGVVNGVIDKVERSEKGRRSADSVGKLSPAALETAIPDSRNQVVQEVTKTAEEVFALLDGQRSAGPEVTKRIEDTNSLNARAPLAQRRFKPTMDAAKEKIQALAKAAKETVYEATAPKSVVGNIIPVDAIVPTKRDGPDEPFVSADGGLDLGAHGGASVGGLDDLWGGSGRSASADRLKEAPKDIEATEPTKRDSSDQPFISAEGGLDLGAHGGLSVGGLDDLLGGSGRFASARMHKEAREAAEPTKREESAGPLGGLLGGV